MKTDLKNEIPAYTALRDEFEILEVLAKLRTILRQPVEMVG